MLRGVLVGDSPTPVWSRSHGRAELSVLSPRLMTRGRHHCVHAGTASSSVRPASGHHLSLHPLVWAHFHQGPQCHNPPMPQPGKQRGRSRIALRRISRARPEGRGEIGFFLLPKGFLGRQSAGQWGEERNISWLMSGPFPGASGCRADLTRLRAQSCTSAHQPPVAPPPPGRIGGAAACPLPCGQLLCQRGPASWTLAKACSARGGV